MHYEYKTQNTCSRKIEFDLIDNKVHNVSFTGGCNGNLKGISKIVEGMTVEQVKEKFTGITCGFKKTSCPDQLAKAVEEAYENE